MRKFGNHKIHESVNRRYLLIWVTRITGCLELQRGQEKEGKKDEKGIEKNR